MARKVKPCPHCMTSYTAEEFGKLALVHVHESDGAEVRRCSCGTELTGNVRFWAKLDLRDGLERFLDELPDEDPRRRREWIRFAQGAALIVALLLSAIFVRLVLLSRG